MTEVGRPQVEVVEAPGARRFEVVLFLALAAYAAWRCTTFAVAVVSPLQSAAVPAIIASSVSLGAWAALWGAGVVLHLLAVTYPWARSASFWTFTIKGVGVALCFIASAILTDRPILPAFGGVASYGAPVAMLWLLQWQATQRTVLVVRSVAELDVGMVVMAARDAIVSRGGRV